MKSIFNKRAYHDYQILDEYTAGIVLTGPEVKSIKNGRVNLTGSFITIDADGQVMLKNANISPYPPAKRSQISYDPNQSRKLLLTTKEINAIRGNLEKKGTALIPLKISTKNRLIKLTIGLAKGKKKYDKRETIKKRESDRAIRARLRTKG